LVGETEQGLTGAVLGASTSPERLPWLCPVRTWETEINPAKLL